jgi:hypothetical protein
LQVCQSARSTFSTTIPVIRRRRRPDSFGNRTAPDHAGCIASHVQLRIATNGYNVSFEKPGVVGHDRPMLFPLADCSIDDCRNGR